MAVTVVLNGVSYTIPDPGNDNWGQNLTDYFVAQASGLLQKAGGAFTLTAEVDFGATYGLKSAYFKSRTSTPAAAGAVRLAKTDSLSWRNTAGGGDLALAINGSDQLTFNGVVIQQAAITVSDTSTIDMTLSSADISAAIKSDCITNSMVNSAAAIAYSKLNLAGSIVNADINASAAIAYSKLNLAGSIVNADLSGSAGITNANLAAMNNNTIKGNVSGGSATPSDLTATQATALLNVFSSTLKGLVPASGGGTMTFLRADGSFQTPPGAGDVVGPASSVDNELVLFNSTSGKLIKRAAGTGAVYVDSGVVTQGTLLETKGGTAQSTYATGDTLYASAANTLSKLSGNTVALQKALVQTGTGAASQAPSWDFLYAGTYTPTLSNTTNIAASTAYLCRYIRIGNTVCVWGQVDIDPTANGPTRTLLGISLPIASTLATVNLLSGCGGSQSITAGTDANMGGSIYADTSNNRASYDFWTTNAANCQHGFSFSYTIQ